VFIALMILKVPAALLLALLAGVFDFIPVLGFALSSIPAIVLAATVSATTAVLVVALYIAYHFIENYFIAPKVYGGELRLSNLAVLISFAVGAELAGVIGALLALPFAAAYPAVERIWLSEHLEPDTVEKHQTLEQATSPK
jgi:predicted PurR-regulated permease PerM